MSTSAQPSRAKFLSHTVALAATAGVLASPARAIAAPNIVARDGGLTALAKDLDGRLLVPGDEAFIPAARPNNDRWAGVVPRAVAMCGSERDVQRCVTYVRDNGIPFAVRSGGHNYAGFSTTTGLLIDVKAMNSVRADVQSGTVTIGGGANNTDVATVLRQTRYAIPSGRCPTVGASGLVLGGGWGFSSTHAGLTCDSMLATNVVTADAALLHADATHESDLFWAARGGGGGNFGVHTSFTLKLHEIGDVTTFNVVWPPGKQIELLTALQAMQRNYPRTISARTKARQLHAGPFPARDEIVVESLGIFFGDERALREAMAPALAILTPAFTDIFTTDYWKARDYLVTDDPNGLYEIRNSYVAETLGPPALETMLTWMTRWPGGSIRNENMGVFFAVGGAVKDVAPAATAYVHRNAEFIFEMYRSWSPADKPDVVERQRAWLSDYYDAMQPYLLPQSYVNFPNRDLKQYAQYYYGSNLPRLSAVKRRYDPHNVFSFPQSVPL